MGALGSLLGIGPAHQVQSKRGEAGFTGWGDDQMGGLMRNDSGISRPNEYTGGYAPNPMSMLGGVPSGFGMGGQFGGQQGGMGQGMGQQRPQGYPYGIQPPQGMMRQQQGQQQPQQQSNPLAGLFSMLGGL